MTTRLILVAVVNVLTLMLAACGGGGDGITVARPDTEQLRQIEEPTLPEVGSSEVEDTEQLVQLETPTESMKPDVEIKRWTCYASSDFRKATPLVSLAYYSGPLDENVAMGSLEVFGAFKPAWLRSTGLNLRWNFGDLDDDLAYPYAFVLEPDGTGLYYDFSMSDDGSAKPSQIFQCLRS